MIRFFQVDAFSKKPFSGNTAGVVIMEELLPPEKMQQIARQNNLPATAFLLDQETHFDIRWFAVQNELPLCGHGSLASAHILFSKGIVPKDQAVEFRSQTDRLSARWIDEWIQLDFPAFDSEHVAIPEDLKECFSRPMLSASITQGRYLLEMETETEVRDAIPDFERLRKYRCIITARADAGAPYDFVSRFFNGPDGIREDAVTGSSHCSLVPYWAQRLEKKSLRALQVSKRGGELKLRLDGDRVSIAGQAVTVIEGVFLNIV